MPLDRNDIPADVICQFTRDGRVIPLKIRFADDNEEFQEYKILGYRETTEHGSGNFKPYLSFDCKIAVYGSSKVIHIFYLPAESLWAVRPCN